MRKMLVFLLLVCTLGVVYAGAQEIGHVVYQPQLLENVEFPEHWSKDALVFCVGNGIIRGREDGLAHLDNTSRAETAAMLVRLLGISAEAPDLSGFTDADPEAWYYAELAAAVEMGIMRGVSATELAPNAPVTREQVFAMLCRAFGICAEDENGWQRFKDGDSIHDYARGAVSALVQRGYLNGYLDGTIQPGKNITRGELAQMFYGMFTHICTQLDQLPESGNVLYSGEEAIPADYQLEGNLTLVCKQDYTKLEGISVSGELVLQAPEGNAVVLYGCSVDTLSVPTSIVVSSDNSVINLNACGEGSRLEVNADTVRVSGSCTLAGNYDAIICGKDSVSFELEGEAEYIRIDGENVIIQGGGHCQQVDSYGYHNQVLVAYDTLQELAYDRDYANALNTVETVDVWDTVITDTYLYSSSGLYNVIRALPKGTKLLHYYIQDGASAASVYTEDGVFGYVPVSCISVPEQLDLAKADYNEATLEGFVDQMGYTSSTQYMIWISLKTQTVNVFTGSQGNWELLRSGPCASGNPQTPTVKGSFYVRYKYNEWNFGTYKVRYVTGFYEGYAFHSRTYSMDYSRMLDDTIGTPASHGCLRMLDEDCKWIFDNIPYNTRVVVY